MPDTPFWKHTPSAGDTAPQTPAGALPTVPGGISAIDPETGAWRPVKRGDPFTIGEHEFRWREGPIATVTVTDGDGNELGRAHVPFDPETQQPGDDMLAEVTRRYQDMEHMRSIVKDDAINALVADILKSGATDGPRSLAEEMVGRVAEVLAGGLKLTVTDDDGSDGLTPDQLETLAAEGERVFNEQLPQLVRDRADIPAENGLTFWQAFAREIIATAALHARDTVTDDLGGPEAVEAMDDDAVEAKVLEAYRTGPYLAGAMLSLTRVWTQSLSELIATGMSDMSQRDEGKELGERLLKQARESLGLPEKPATSAEAPPTITPAFDADGYGRADNSVVAIGARHALSAPGARWNIDVEAWPVFTHENGSGKALYSPSRSHFPTARDAMRAVENYGPAHVAMLKYITAMHLANSTSKTSGPYGGFYVSIDDYLNVVGRAKHQKGGYRPEDRREVVELIEALERIEVTGNVEGYEKGKRGRKSTLTIRSPLIVVSHRVTQPGMLDGEERPVAWYLRAGDWAAELERFGLQYAVMTKALLQLNTQNDRHAFNLGNFLTEQYRIRASQQSWKQPYRARTLLDGAEIEVDRKHAGRFRERIEAALDVLGNPVTMNGTPIIESWEYTSDVVEAKGRGWLDHWLNTGIIITPTAGLIAPYHILGRHRRKPQKLVG
jgi:hypothetical protein